MKPQDAKTTTLDLIRFSFINFPLLSMTLKYILWSVATSDFTLRLQSTFDIKTDLDNLNLALCLSQFIKNDIAGPSKNVAYSKNGRRWPEYNHLSYFDSSFLKQFIKCKVNWYLGKNINIIPVFSLFTSCNLN